VIDRSKVQRSFHRQACEYDNHTVVQKRVVARLLDILSEEGETPSRILDVGTGTGLLARHLADRYPDAFLSCIDLAPGMAVVARQRLGRRGLVAVADAEHLPFAGEAFDCVVSASTFQWLTTLDNAFGEAWRVLAPGGRFAFALFGHGTFHELKTSYRAALASSGRAGEDRTQRFFPVDEVSAAMTRAGFAACRVLCEDEVERHPDVPTFLRAVKRAGAGNASPLPSRGLAERRVMVEMMRVYGELFGDGDGIPATYSVIYGAGVKVP
jgi:malonyl-CoA O-methyltransferase